MPKFASSSSSSSPTFLFFIISLPSNLHGHSTLVARAPLPFPRDPRPPSVGRRAEGPGGRTERRRHRQWGSIFFRFARALAVAMAMAAAMAGSRSRPHLPACLPQPLRGAYPKNSIDGISYIGRAELEGRPFSPSYSMLGRVLFLLSNSAARLTKLVGAGLRETRFRVTQQVPSLGRCSAAPGSPSFMSVNL